MGDAENGCAFLSNTLDGHRSFGFSQGHLLENLNLEQDENKSFKDFLDPNHGYLIFLRDFRPVSDHSKDLCKNSTQLWKRCSPRLNSLGSSLSNSNGYIVFYKTIWTLVLLICSHFRFIIVSNLIMMQIKVCTQAHW